HVGGAGEQEAPRRPVSIYLQLDRSKEFGSALHFVYHHRPFQGPDETARICLSGCQHRRVVERKVACRVCPFEELLNQRTLPCLPGAVDEHYRRVIERLKEYRCNIACDHG